MAQHEHGDATVGATAPAAQWDARYLEHDAAMWSGRVLSVEPAIGRLSKAADLVDSIDFVVDVEPSSIDVD